jgi:aspartate kinase
MNVEVDMIVQNQGEDDTTDFTFTVARNDYQKVVDYLDARKDELGAKAISGNNRIVKISIVGVGMRSHAGIASRMFKALADANVNLGLISTSEIKVSVVIDENYLELGVRALHEEFGLAETSA